MSRRAWIFLFLGVVAVHGLIFLLIKDGPVIPPQWLISGPPEPTFKYDQAKYVDPVTGEKMVVKEFTMRVPSDSAQPSQPTATP